MGNGSHLLAFRRHHRVCFRCPLLLSASFGFEPLYLALFWLLCFGPSLKLAARRGCHMSYTLLRGNEYRATGYSHWLRRHALTLFATRLAHSACGGILNFIALVYAWGLSFHNNAEEQNLQIQVLQMPASTRKAHWQTVPMGRSTRDCRGSTNAPVY